MTSGILVLIIVSVFLIQFAIFVLPGLYRRNKLSKNPDSVNNPVNPPDNTSGSSIHWQGFREFIVHHKLMEDSSNSVCSFYLIPADGKPLPSFKPGQYLTFKLDIKDQQKKRLKLVTRNYSLSDAPHTDYYRVSIKRALAPAQVADAQPGLVSNYFHDRIKKDSRLLVKAPAGQFHLLNDEDLPIVLIGGGIGITPMLSIINTLLESGSKLEIYLFYGVRNSSEHIMKQHFQTLTQKHKNFHLHVCYSAASDTDIEGDDFHHRGRVDIALLRSMLKLKLIRYQFYICGPGAMIESLVPELIDRGVDSKDIYFESFGPSSLKRIDKTKCEHPAQAVSISFARSGKTLQWDSNFDSLLEFAEAHNIEVESGCRSGSCGGCQTGLQTGDVSYNLQPDAEITEGHCLLCISTPKNDLTLNA
jgi:uncharacterized protein